MTYNRDIRTEVRSLQNMQLQPRVMNIRKRYRLYGLFALLLLSACSQDADKTVDLSKERQAEVEQPQAPPAEADLGQPTPEQSLSEPSELIKDLGFSGIEDDTSQKEAPKKEVPFFCLNKVSPEYQIEKACDKISKRLASVSYESCAAAQLSQTGCMSVAKFPILMREFAPIDEIAPKGRILVIGGTHGDELTSVSIMFRWIEKLNRHHSGRFHWHMVPMMNPDGVLKPEATRTNENGVDLNRNLPSEDWESLAHKYWETKGSKSARKFPGDKAASEPEVQFLIDEINSFKPDAIIAVHAPYGIVDFDSHTLKTAPKSLGKLHLNLLGTYPGSLGNYAGINRNIPVITLELPHSWIMPSESETTQIWEDIVAWLNRTVGPNIAQNENGGL